MRLLHVMLQLQPPQCTRLPPSTTHQETQRLDPITPRIYSGASIRLLQEHGSSDSEDVEGE